MVTFNRFNATCPLVFMVFDRVTSTNASFKKTWLLHSLEEPGIAARRMTIVNNRPRYDKNGNLDTTKGRYSGKLVVDCLLPRQAVIRKVGGPGKEFWIESAATNYTMSDTPAAAFEVGAWRLEVSPEAPVLADQFLHAMAVMDKDTALLETSALLDCGTMVGAALLGKAVLFSKDGLLRDSVWFDLGVRPYDVLLVDLTPGLWKIQAGQNKNIYTVNDTARCLYLPDCRGAYTLQAGTTSIAPVPDGQSEGIAVSCLRNRIMAVTVRVREPQMVRLTLYGVDGKQMARPLVRKLNNRTTLVHYPYFGVAGVYVLECRGASFSVHRKFLLTPQ
jgi:heparin/heparan-sulfate lyase